MVPEATRKNVIAAASGRMLPENLSHIPEVLNTWSALMGTNVPVMVQAQLGRVVGGAIGTLVGGPGGAVVGGVAGGVLAMSLMEAGNYLETAEYAGIDPAIASRDAAIYGLVSGSIEYAQQAFMAKPFRRAFNAATGGARNAMQGQVAKWLLRGQLSVGPLSAAGNSFR